MANLKNVVIIGSGPAGYTAAIYAARADLKPILISGIQPGGQLTITTDVENYPGYENPIQGPWLMEQMQKQSLLVGTEIINNHVEKVELHGDIKKIYLDNGETINSKAVIICTGAQARWLGLESEEKYNGVDCFVVEYDPVDRKSGYSIQKTWIDQSKYIILKTEYYDRKKSLLKTLTFDSYKKYEDKFWRADTFRMINHQTGKETELQYENWVFGTGLSEKDFNKSMLKKIK